MISLFEDCIIQNRCWPLEDLHLFPRDIGPKLIPYTCMQINTSIFLSTYVDINAKFPAAGIQLPHTTHRFIPHVSLIYTMLQDARKSNACSEFLFEYATE